MSEPIPKLHPTLLLLLILHPRFDISLISHLGNTFLHESIQLKNLSIVLFFYIPYNLPFRRPVYGLYRGR